MVEESQVSHPRTTVVNLRTYKGDDYILIDRRTAFGNPFKIGIDGDRKEVVRKHKRYFRERMKTDPQFEQEIYALVGCRLACWCAPLSCHGDNIAELLNEGLDNG